MIGEHEPVTWVALIAALGGLVACAKFWMDMGATRKIAENASQQAVTAHATAEILRSELRDARVEIAQDYASHKALAACESRIGEDVRGMREEIRGLNERFDRFLTNMVPR